jgi:hypothetical protein
MLIELSDNIVLQNYINLEYFEIIKTNKISSEIIVRTIKPTKEKILVSSSLKEIIS